MKSRTSKASRLKWYYSNKVHAIAKVKSRAKDLIAFVRGLKASPCVDCGKQYPHYVMQFDHVRGVKSIGLAMVARNGWSRKRILTEAAKCEIVCANCHASRTWARLHP
mgnify:FL=1